MKFHFSSPENFASVRLGMSCALLNFPESYALDNNTGTWKENFLKRKKLEHKKSKVSLPRLKMFCDELDSFFQLDVDHC